IGWSAIRADLPILLQALDAPEKHGLWRAATVTAVVQGARNTTADSALLPEVRRPTAADQKDNLIGIVQQFETLGVDALSVVGDYCRFDEKTRNQLKDWKIRIASNFKIK